MHNKKAPASGGPTQLNKKLLILLLSFVLMSLRCCYLNHFKKLQKPLHKPGSTVGFAGFIYLHFISVFISF